MSHTTIIDDVYCFIHNSDLSDKIEIKKLDFPVNKLYNISDYHIIDKHQLIKSALDETFYNKLNISIPYLIIKKFMIKQCREYLIARIEQSDDECYLLSVINKL